MHHTLRRLAPRRVRIPHLAFNVLVSGLVWFRGDEFGLDQEDFDRRRPLSFHRDEQSPMTEDDTTCAEWRISTSREKTQKRLTIPQMFRFRPPGSSFWTKMTDFEEKTKIRLQHPQNVFELFSTLKTTNSMKNRFRIRWP